MRSRPVVIATDGATPARLLGEQSVSDSQKVTTTKVREFDTLQGQSIFLSLDEGGPHVNQSNIACQTVETNNGTIWVIDSVLLRQFQGPYSPICGTITSS